MQQRANVTIALPAMRRLALAITCLGAVPIAHAGATAEALSPVVVTATRVEQSSFDLPLAIDSVDADSIRAGNAQVNVSESLNRVPGTVVSDRGVFSQEQQITLRGFGARAAFGVRGIRLIADGIPASTPDGQGGTGLFDLSSAARIEVLRGAFSALYGNHSGGVIQVFTEDGPAEPTIEPSVMFGSYNSRRVGVKFGGTSGNLNYTASVSRFDTDGFRDWSDARKDQANVKFKWQASPDTLWTFVANSLDQPDNKDPLGLTAAQMAANPHQAQAVALQFQTRRSLSNLQGGLAMDTRINSRDDLHVTVYSGTRQNQQFLAIPLFVQNFATHSGGVSAYDRMFWGLGARLTHRYDKAMVTVGADFDQADDDRKGYINDLGVQGALKRNEDNRVRQAGAYMQAQWDPTRDWTVSGGVRYTRVDFRSVDHYIVGANPDDSGSVSYDAWTPSVGVLYHVTPTFNLYANAGRSMETPTFIELAYRNSGSGLNFDLKPAISHQYEVGAKAFLGAETHATAALFLIDTDQELVVDTNSGGRATYKNAGKTRRYGIETSLDSNLGKGFRGYVSATWLSAEFRDTFVSGSNTISSGNRIPGIPAYQLYGELTWKYAPLGMTAGVEELWVGKVYANDTNADTADRYSVTNLRVGFEQPVGGWKLSEFARVNNVGDNSYVGAVYVNDGNGRYYAPAAGRNWLAGLSAAYRF